MACKHVVEGTGQDGYMGFQICPYCGAYARMFTEFVPVDQEDKEIDEGKRPPATPGNRISR